jgi:hypothetical protein
LKPLLLLLLLLLLLSRLIHKTALQEKLPICDE